MSGHPPPPPPRKPPPSQMPPAANKPPPGGGMGGGYPPEPPENSGASTGMIVGIIAAVLFVLIGLPLISCVGCVVYARYQANQFIQEIEEDLDQQRSEEQQRQLAQETAILTVLADRLYPQAKLDIGIHWTEPADIRRRRWADWTARKISDHRYEIKGILQLSFREQGSTTYNWACEYSTFDNPASAGANWTLERVTIDGEQHFP